MCCTGQLFSQITVNIEYTVPDCPGYSSSVATAHATGGTPPYTYQWSNGYNWQTIANITSGDLSVTVTDSNWGTGTKSVNVELPAPVEIVIDGGDYQCDVDAGTMTAVPSGGTPPYTINWSNGQSGASISGLTESDFYFVTVVDSKGCLEVEGKSFSGPLKLNMLVIDGACAGDCDGSIEAKATGGAAPYSYQWDFGMFQSNWIQAPAPLGNYNVTVTDAAGCTKVGNGYVGEPEPIEVDVALSAPCSDNSNATATAIGGVPPYTYQWNSGSWGPTAYGLYNGTFTVVVKDANNCSVEKEVSIGEAELQVNATSNAADCSDGTGGSATIDAIGGTGNFTYEWSNGATTKTAENLPAGDYTITVTEAGGCTGITSVTIEDPGDFEILTSSVPAGCTADGGSATIQVTGAIDDISCVWDDPLNQAGETAFNLLPGIYNVTVSNSFGCTEIASVEVEDMAMESFVEITNAGCNDAQDGGAEAMITSGGAAPFTYKWSNGQTGAVLNNVNAGSYAVTITDANGCSEEAAVDIQNEAFEIELNVLAQGCADTNEGVIEATVIGGGQAPYSFNWSNGNSTPTASNLSSGSISITVEDAAGCEQIMSFDMPDLPEMQITSNVTNAACEGLANGVIEAAVTDGGLAPYSYAWSNGVTGETNTDLEAGTYELIVTDANGCTQSSSFEVESLPFEFTTSVSDTDCDNVANGSATLEIVNGGMPPFQYQWSNGSTEPTADNLEPGNYNFTITDALGCEQSEQIVIQPNTSLDVAFDWQIVDCDNGGVMVAFNDATSSNGSTPAAWQWNLSSGETADTQNPQIFVPSGSPVTVELTVTNADGCAETLVQEIEVEALDVQVPNAQTVCQNGVLPMEAVVVSSFGNVSFDWGPDNLIQSGDGTPNCIINTAIPGNYMLTLTMNNGLGCSIQEYIQVTINPSIEPQSGSVDYNQCSNLTVDFSYDGTDDVTWHFDYPNNPSAISVETNPSFSYSEPGAYTVAVIPNGSCAEILLLPINVDTAPIADFAVLAGNCSDPVELSFTNNSTLPSAINSMIWDFGALGTSNDENPTLTVNESQTVTAQLTIQYGDNCEVSIIEEIDVNIFTPPTLTNEIYSCSAGLEMELNPNADPNSNYVYNWTAPTTATLSSTTVANPIANISSNSTFTATISDAVGCQSIQEVSVLIPSPQLAIQPIDDVVSCDYTQVNLVAETNVPASGFIWSNDPEFENQITTEAALLVTPPNDPIMYYVQATDAFGCTATESVMVSNLASGLNFDQAFEVCNGSTIEFDIAGVNPETEISDWTPFNPLITPLTNNTVFTFNYTNPNGCSKTESFAVMVSDFDPNLQIAADPTEIYQGETSQLSVTGNGNLSYTWTPGETLDNSTITNPEASPTETTVYRVEAYDEVSGCSSSRDIEVKVKESICDQPNIYLPNAFTPNDDGVNDVLKVRGVNLDEVFLSVYDRWGEKVFETDSQDIGWDGTYKGVKVTGDVYGYYLKVKCFNGREYFTKGNITVIR